MYTIESLIDLNSGYHAQHRVTQRDVDMVNNYIASIETSRNDTHIQAGDIVELTTKYGEFYPNAHVEKYTSENNEWSVCEQPYTPFVYINNQGKICCNTSGGAWCSVPNNLKLIGKRQKLFKDFGRVGATSNGSVSFMAMVNVWEYKQDNPLFGEYTTKDWDKFYVSYVVDEQGQPKNGSSYRWFVSKGGMSSTAFITQADYDAWLKTIRAVSFDGHWPNQKVVFGYKQHKHLINKDAWDKLYLPMDTRLCNGINLCKVKYNDATHTIDVYRFDNAGHLDWKQYKEYELARGMDLVEEIR